MGQPTLSPTRSRWQCYTCSLGHRRGTHSANGFDGDVVKGVAKLRRDHLEDAKAAAAKIDVDPKAIRCSMKMFSRTTAIGADMLHLKRLASLPDVALA